ncbi:PQQ-dependent sugar dehydrogenase [Nocardioides sp. zg-DK7169]|uniref:PQQ-dependent sugar dehydrogenase n=1 Tax=Nocardioides sp. zg-DK7169 TaxID=2736600 RepID=UPI0015536C77|nr:PQQ-dependent sugar dehydrogenase [Nocardioides sp. zg-DK7169]NPC96623.1 PQQ-dependent sugar dehydrogenase [Nocardioides sp. zg-DK7169]
MRTLSVAATALLALGFLSPAASAAPDPGAAAGAGARAEAPASRAAPALRVRTVVGGLDIPWHVQPIGGGRLLVTERNSARLWLVRDGAKRQVRFPSRQVWRSGETGLMSLEGDPRFADNRRFYTCQGARGAGGSPQVQVVAWRLGPGARRAVRVRTLLSGLPAARDGRHGGCRLLVLRDGSLLFGTGDATVGTNPRNLSSYGGKTLRLVRTTGAPWPGNPWAKARKKAKRYVFTYGHRNVQGLAQRRDGTLWSVEHGSYRDDEVNRLIRGGDYGWNPVPGYNQSVPMTDQSLPGRQRAARWRSGPSTIATSGAAFVPERGWGAYGGNLAVAALAGQRVVFLQLDRRGKVVRTRVPDALRRYGRLRSVSVAPGGSLLITTSNGGNDKVLRVSPR